MPFGDPEWLRRNPESFEAVGAARERCCECGAKLVEAGRFHARQDHPWRPPRVTCDCGQIHQVVGLKVTA